jgi:hypothetical protein
MLSPTVNDRNVTPSAIDVIINAEMNIKSETETALTTLVFLVSMLCMSLNASGRSLEYSLRHIKQLAIIPTNSQPNCS